jgi:sarcosine oxidase, subunit alpha
MGEGPAHRFRFDGRYLEVQDGTTLAQALSHDGPPVLQRSIRYHRPRAPVCGVGYCTGCLVRVDGRPNVRSCRYVPANGDVVRTENSWPSPRFDVMGALDVLFPGGVDTLRGFRRPAWMTGAYQRVVRRLAGYGDAPSADALAPSSPPIRRSTDVVVIGGGRSGRATADRLAAAGRDVLVVDRSLSTPGGSTSTLAATVTFLPPRRSTEAPFELLGFSEPSVGVAITARTVVVATGGYDANLLFEANDRPGILTADGAFALAGSPDRPPFRRAVVVGGGARADEVLRRFGDHVEALVAPGVISPEVTQRASELDIPLYPRTRIESAAGRSRVRNLRLRSRGTRLGFDLACDAVVLAHRRLPTPQLFFQAGAHMEWRGGVGAYYPTLGSDGTTTVPGLYAVGETAGVLPGGASVSGERAADAILGRPVPESDAPARVPEAGPAELEGYYRELLASHRGGRWVACPCEDVLLSEVEEASRGGYRGIEVVKRYTGLGTGLCQGRYCLPDALLLLSILEGRPPAEVGYITQRPPVVPTPLAALAALASPSASPEAT